MIHCNSCWKEFIFQDQCYITACQHAFCEHCANKQFTNDRVCPICETSLIQIFGLSPNEILKIAEKAIDFWTFQTGLYRDNEGKKVDYYHEQFQKLKSTFLKQTEDFNSRIDQYRKQTDILKRETDNNKKEIIELQEKLAEKTRQKRKLEELYEHLKRKLDNSTNSSHFTGDLSSNTNTTGVTTTTTNSNINIGPFPMQMPYLSPARSTISNTLPSIYNSNNNINSLNNNNNNNNIVKNRFSIPLNSNKSPQLLPLDNSHRTTSLAFNAYKTPSSKTFTQQIPQKSPLANNTDSKICFDQKNTCTQKWNQYTSSSSTTTATTTTKTLSASTYNRN
ncbi:hypothetical protein PPL_04682 [Heterostelium album PN500]|uniref:RING-type domain-containing protein n=1 Tax=Heterostelium pallidum (strain ATCC 26659 / Pp 5 / PN500) TaxID=670386 RepID=D3B891_HETP5|nr:hypothetical protein PPL_04682 [Heterostelium album PN500]EFA82259.1 hypothetical protein PPL_04682 [Heterostelium album PN500]|eukprot:XP_020434376.1 hypothetical protein PPL_04682 [Heterostelium album PN500]